MDRSLVKRFEGFGLVILLSIERCHGWSDRLLSEEETRDGEEKIRQRVQNGKDESRYTVP